MRIDFYTQQSVMTSAEGYASMFDELPNDVGELVRVIQGLVVYDAVASDFYSFNIPEERKTEIHIRRVEQMLDQLAAIDDQPLDVARPVHKRLVGRCHHFILLLVAMLRAKGVPARARGGFGAYFNPGYFEDHWVCEYWDANEGRWVLVDPQFDDVWREKLNVQHDVLDVPRSQFLVAADAWERCRSGKIDASKFGIYHADLRGLWFIAGSLVRDAAALNKMEMLPWDVWGAQSRTDKPLTDDQLAFFDKLVALLRNPDESFEELRMLYESNGRLRVPAKVCNMLLKRSEAT